MADYIPSNFLKFLSESANIDITAIEREFNMQKRQDYLNSHNRKIWQGKNGCWYTTVPCQDRKDGRRLIKRKTRESLDDAIVDYYENPGKQIRTLFSTVFKNWIEYKLDMGEICKGTYDRYIQDYTRYIKGTDFDKKRIKQITEDDIEELIRKVIVENNLKSKAYAGFRTLIIGTFKYAKRKKLTDISISMFFSDLDLSRRIFRSDTKKDKMQVYTADEVRILMDWLLSHPHIMNFGIAFDFLTGLRSGELSGLKYSDLNGDELHVQRQQIRFLDDDNKYKYEVVDYTKTADSDRYVAIPQKAISIFKQMRLMNPWGEYIFQGYNKQQFNKYLKKACDACGIEYRSMHKIRKTYATNLIDKGVEYSVIKSQMGHSDIKTTMEHYYFSNKGKDYIKQQIEGAVNY